jgi:hypothetical protein
MSGDKIVHFPAAAASPKIKSLSLRAAAAEWDATTRAWQKYVERARLAQVSHRIEDGIAAGHAWAEFLDLFAPVPRPPRGVA